MNNKTPLQIVLDHYKSNNLKYVYLAEKDYYYICNEPKWGERKIFESFQMIDFMEFYSDGRIASISEKYIGLCEKLGITNNNNKDFPDDFRHVLAKIGKPNETLKYSIIFYAQGNWHNWNFQKDEVVLEWKYLEDCF